MSEYKLKGSTIKCNLEGECESPFEEFCRPPEALRVKTDAQKLLECLGCKNFIIKETTP